MLWIIGIGHLDQLAVDLSVTSKVVIEKLNDSLLIIHIETTV